MREIVFATDTTPIEPELYRRIEDLITGIDALFIGLECVGAPLSWLYGPLMGRMPDRRHNRGRRLNGADAAMAEQLAKALGVKRIWIKDDTGNPTHSFKDRVVAVALAAAREFGFKVLACPSTGNLANAVAAAGARAGIRTVVFIPHDLEPAKVQMTAVYGGSLVAVRGSYDDVNRLASEIAGEEEGWFSAAEFEENMSTHYGRMVHLDDRTIMFANPEDAAEYLDFDLKPV